MNETPTNADAGRERPAPSLSMTLSALLLGVGLLLLAFMVTVESEPGALPLALILAGAVWHVAARRRRRVSARP